jgi:serine/threonine-protein kinase
LVLKQLKPALADDPHLVTMFLAEATLAAGLSHPNVVQTLEVGSDGGHHYIVMEHLDGQPFSRMLSRARRSGMTWPLHVSLAVAVGALEGLAYLHRLTGPDEKPIGLVHRDVSPDNVFVTYDGQVKLLDFGIAKATDVSGTQAGLLEGKVAYMAPEQAAGGRCDARTDVFAAGVILFEAVIGQRFWADAGDHRQILRALVDGELPSRRTGIFDGVLPELGWVIQNCTAHDPFDRYADAGAVLADLLPLVRQIGPTPFGPKPIGQALHELFSEDRARLNATIQTRLADVRSGAAERPVELRPDEAVPASAPQSSSNPPTVATTLSPSVSPGVASPRGSQASVWAVAAIAIVAIGAVATRGPTYIATASRGPTGIASAEPSLPRAPTTPVAASETASPSISETVAVRASPGSARIWLDGRELASNPTKLVLPRDGRHHVLDVEAPGYAPQLDEFDANGDDARTILLQPYRPSGEAPSRTPSSEVKPECSPPYIVEPATGKKHWKVQCL